MSLFFTCEYAVMLRSINKRKQILQAFVYVTNVFTILLWWHLNIKSNLDFVQEIFRKGPFWVINQNDGT